MPSSLEELPPVEPGDVFVAPVAPAVPPTPPAAAAAATPKDGEELTKVVLLYLITKKKIK